MLVLFTAYFKTANFLPIKRSELFSNTDLIASCGGLLGLFLGFSLLSVIEIIYYCTIRPLLVWRHRSQRLARKQSLKIVGNKLKHMKKRQIIAYDNDGNEKTLQMNDWQHITFIKAPTAKYR